MTSVPAVLLALALLVQPATGRGRLRVARSIPLRQVPAAAKAAGAAAVAVLAVLSVPAAAALSALLVVGTAHLRWGRRITRRRAEREGQDLDSALELLVGELRAGAHPVRAFENAAAEVGGSVGAGLHAVSARAGLGADVPAGLRAVAARSRLPLQWHRLAACWELASDHGLPISIQMRAAQRDIAERRRYHAQVDAGMAGARATAAILAGLPMLGVALGELLGAAPTAFLLSYGAGGWVLLAGVTLLCGGVWWSGRITDRLPG